MPFEILETQLTPNPNALKYVLSGPISAKPESFFNAASATGHAVAKRLFEINGVTSVLLLRDFVTVNKQPDAKWSAITPAVKKVLGEP